MKVLHITTHLGGGVGKALSSIVTYERRNNPAHEHRVLLLDEPEKDQFLNICRKGGVEVLLKSGGYDTEKEMAAADVVVLHWWHHPVMAEFLARFPRVPVRLVLWAHVNGCNYPCLPFGFADLPHKTFFTSPFSLENTYWTPRQREKIRKNSAVVYGLGELDFRPAAKKERSKDFVVGYVGTLSSSKLHPQFVEFCYAVLKKVPAARFVLVGDAGHSEALLRKARAYRIDHKLSLTGYCSQIADELARFDVFAYPLNPKHFGTTENVLLEAMAFGLPVVALNHNTEKYIICDHKKVGLLADSVEHYADSLKYLYDNPRERARLGANAREYVKANFTFEKNVELMRVELKKVAKMSARRFNFSGVFGGSPHEWFLACLGEDRPHFSESVEKGRRPTAGRKRLLEEKIRASSPILREKTKSSIAHFAASFPSDRELQYWKELMTLKTTRTDGPLVSIGIPSYNRPEGLRKALECFTKQTYGNLEIIVSDNCSSDDPTELVESLARKDPRVKYYRQPRNLGMKSNGDFLFQKATGKYFILGSDDDWWNPDFVSELVKAILSEEGAVCAFCDFEEVDESGQKIVSMSRYATARKLLGLKVHSYPDHYPLLTEFSLRDPAARLRNFILQKEYDGKANVHRALCDRQVFLESIKRLYDLGMADCWAFDQLLAFTMLTRGQLALSDRMLFRCTVGNTKHYSDPRSKLEYLKGYAKVVDHCFEEKTASGLRAAINERYTDRRVGFFQEYEAGLRDFAKRAAAAGDDASLAALRQALNLVKAGEHSGAFSVAASYMAAHAPVHHDKRRGTIGQAFFRKGEKKVPAIAGELVRAVRDL